MVKTFMRSHFNLLIWFHEMFSKDFALSHWPCPCAQNEFVTKGTEFFWLYTEKRSMTRNKLFIAFQSCFVKKVKLKYWIQYPRSLSSVRFKYKPGYRNHVTCCKLEWSHWLKYFLQSECCNFNQWEESNL